MSMVFAIKGRGVGAFLILGLVLILGATAWILIFSRLQQMPADYARVTTFQGTVQVLDPATLQLKETPVKVAREHQALGTRNGVLLIKEEVPYVRADTGEPLTGELSRLNSSSELGVDRRSRAYVKGYGDLEREGQFSLPGNLQKTTYPLWIPTVNKALPARYVGTESFRGMKVYVYRVEEKGLPFPPDPAYPIPMKMDADIILKAEPISGTTIGQESLTTVTIEHPLLGKRVASVSQIGFDEEAMARLLDTARSAKTYLLFLGRYVPGILLGAGITCFLWGGLGLFKREKKARKGELPGRAASVRDGIV